MKTNNTDVRHGNDHQDAALDAALAESFPASDPVAISFPAAVRLASKRIVARSWRVLVEDKSPKFRKNWTPP